MLLKRKADTDKKAIGLGDNVVVLIEVKQTKTVAAKQVEVGELYVGTEHSVKVETALVAVVTIPVGSGCSTQKGFTEFGGTREGETRHRTDKWNDNQVAVHSDLLVEQNRHIDKDLCFLGCSSDTQ